MKSYTRDANKNENVIKRRMSIRWAQVPRWSKRLWKSDKRFLVAPALLSMDKIEKVIRGINFERWDVVQQRLTFEEIVLWIGRVRSCPALDEIVALDQVVMTGYLMAFQLITRLLGTVVFINEIAKLETIVFSWFALFISDAVLALWIETYGVLLRDLVSFDFWWWKVWKCIQKICRE